MRIANRRTVTDITYTEVHQMHKLIALPRQSHIIRTVEYLDIAGGKCQATVRTLALPGLDARIDTRLAECVHATQNDPIPIPLFAS